MGKRILRVYLAKNDTPYSAAYAKLDLPASPWEVWDAMEKVRLQTDDILYMEIEDYPSICTSKIGPIAREAAGRGSRRLREI